MEQFGIGIIAAMIEVFTMWPPSPCARMRGSTVRMPLITPPIMTSRPQSQSSNFVLSMAPNNPRPGVVHQHVDLAERGFRLVRGARVGLAVGDVELDGAHAPAELLREEPRLGVLEMRTAPISRRRLRGTADHRRIRGMTWFHLATFGAAGTPNPMSGGDGGGA